MEDELKQLRKRIDGVDEQILRSINERVRICSLIGATKRKNGAPTRDPAREKQVYDHVRLRALQFGLEPARLESVYRQIVNMCSSVQE